jgi:predicted amidohydrolase
MIRQAASLAGDFQLNWVFGFLERDGERVFNTAVLMTRGGQRHFYRKVHLPKLGVDQFATAGCEFPVVDVEGVRIGLNICYDCSFPEPARVMALQGVDLIVLPTNWPPGADTTAEYIPNARALENHVYFMAINRVGDERGFHFIGKSKICHPLGHALAYANHDREEILMAEIEPAVARNKHLVRVPGKHEIHRMADRRPETYTALSREIERGTCRTD